MGVRTKDYMPLLLLLIHTWISCKSLTYLRCPDLFEVTWPILSTHLKEADKFWQNRQDRVCWASSFSKRDRAIVLRPCELIADSYWILHPQKKGLPRCDQEFCQVFGNQAQKLPSHLSDIISRFFPDLTLGFCSLQTLYVALYSQSSLLCLTGKVNVQEHWKKVQTHIKGSFDLP